MPKKAKKTRFDEDLECLRNLLRNEHGEEGVLMSKFEFWARFRTLIAENDSAVGLEALDNLAVRILRDDEDAAYEGTVLLLPAPDELQLGTAPFHPLFTHESETPPTSSKRPALRSASKTKAPPAKKRRTTPKKAIDDFKLPGSTPAQIKLDLASIVQVATSRGVAPFRIAYPWVGQRCWYDPKEYPDLHLMHYRDWMRHRRVFYACTLYAPAKNSDERRKLKLLATAARIEFVSYNVEEFGYYGFLDRFENRSHDSLMWLGGKAAKHSQGAKEASGPSKEDLATLFAKDRPRYDRVLARALNPAQIDEDGYTSIPELLEQAQLIDPTRKLHQSLSNRALARIKLDVANGPPPVHYWVGNRSSGPWKALLADRTLRPVEGEAVRLLLSKKKVAVYDEKKFKRSEQGDDDSDFEGDGEYTAMAPIPPIQFSGSPEAESDVEELSHTGLTEDSEGSEDEDEGQVSGSSGKRGKGKSSDCKSSGGDSSDGRPSRAKAGGHKSAGSKAGGGKPGEGEPSESKAGGSKLDEGKPPVASTDSTASNSPESKPAAAKDGSSETDASKPNKPSPV